MRLALLAALGLLAATVANAADRPPNIVIIMADDLGYGDLGCYGHPSIRTPNLDRMAAEGLRFTDFYSGAPVCTPSRAALLTGRLPIRSGMASDRRRVLFPGSKGGLPAGEITISEALKERGYATACIGKWHLGAKPQHAPREHGFDHFFGLPYSNDMDAVPGIPRGAAGSLNPKSEYWNVPLIRNGVVVERPADQPALTRRYTAEAQKFIVDHREKPFFLYMPHAMPHVPLFASIDFTERSRRGLYGDVVEELDWSVGEILKTLRDSGLAGNTLVFFTSDNGPWLTQRIAGGSAGLLRDGKGSTWEGGVRVPGIAWWPGRIAPGRVSGAIAGAIDFFPTALKLAGAPHPADRPIDGRDLGPILFDGASMARQSHFYYRDATLFAVRRGPWKAHFHTQSGYAADLKRHDPPLLFNLDHDPGEQYDVASANADVVRDLKTIAGAHTAAVQAAENQLAIGAQVIEPQADGTILLHARDAVVHGPVLRYEPETNKITLGYWTKRDDWASWDFSAPSGDYRIEALQGCGPGSGGSEVLFRIGAQELKMTVQETRHFQDFIPRAVGSVTLEAGEHQLEVRALSKPGVAVMDLRQVRLIPAPARIP